MEKRIGNINVENARIAFKNFSGRATKITPKGIRTFSLILDEDMADKLISDGWNVRYLRPREEGDEPTPILDVKVRLDEDTPVPAEIYLIQNGLKHRLYEDTVGMLDEMTFDNIDLIIRPYSWEFGGKTGVKAYLKTLYASGLSDTITSKYLDIPMAED